MAIYLVVGQPRHGKSQFCAKMAYEYHLKNIEIQKRIDSGKFDPEKDIVREIYSDIKGHAENCDFVKPAPEDWRDVPNNSIIFMDEIHQRPEYADTDGRMSQNPMISELRTHGHQNKDIILITQDPQTLNKAIRALVEKMYLVKRPIQKPPFATIYEFERWLRDPWQAAASERSVKYQDKYKFLYKKKWQDMYESASAHTSISFKIQNKFIYALIAIICLSSLSYYLFTAAGGDKLARQAAQGFTKEGANSFVDSAKAAGTKQGTTAQVNSSIPDLTVECRKAVNVEKPECVKFFDDLASGKKSVLPTGEIVQAVYDSNNPYDFEYKPVDVKPVDFPRMSGVIKLSSGRLMAIDQQGNYMPKVSEQDCKRWLDGYRPFDYFRTPNQNGQISTQANYQKPSELPVQGDIQEAAKI
ncbi:zonular occludens toxin domain-containing protein [Acinetobacter thermotolerans]|uniref:zonular occludens toxin domain-containing protein n=1 Tax=Acinetobacter thermotolerans TaxID=3151487 RepID=UPI00325BA8C4